MPSKRTKVSTAAQHKGGEPLEESSNDGEPEKKDAVYTTAECQQGQSLPTWYIWWNNFTLEVSYLMKCSVFPGTDGSYTDSLSFM